jgi:hypothetical protein
MEPNKSERPDLQNRPDGFRCAHRLFRRAAERGEFDHRLRRSMLDVRRFPLLTLHPLVRNAVFVIIASIQASDGKNLSLPDDDPMCASAVAIRDKIHTSTFVL